MGTVRLARMAMATRFELLLDGEDEAWLRAAGEEALSEVQRLDAQLSIYRPSSEVSRINEAAASRAVRIEPRLFSLLKTAQRIYVETDGAFDLTVAPLMRAWGFFRESGRVPEPAALDEARSVTGMHLVELDEGSTAIRFAKEGVRLDFGAIGKGFAVDEAMALLAEAGVERAFLHGGTSTISALGASADGGPWKVAVTHPTDEDASSDESLVTVVPLNNSSLSVSAVWGRAFEAGGRVYGHVLDPRLGRPVDGALLTAVQMRSATESDAYSTALLVQGRQCGELLASLGGRMRSLLLFSGEGDHEYEIMDGGLAPLSTAAHPSATYRYSS